MLGALNELIISQILVLFLMQLSAFQLLKFSEVKVVVVFDALMSGLRTHKETFYGYILSYDYYNLLLLVLGLFSRLLDDISDHCFNFYRAVVAISLSWTVNRLFITVT